MTAFAGAPLTRTIQWKAINWNTVEYEVKRLQLRIAKAIKIGRYAKAKALQWLLTHSFYGKLLAVKRVTQNTGKRTPGIDGVVWKIKPFTLIKAAYTKIKRHIKIKGRATPYDADYEDYFTIREDMLKRERINNRIVNNNFKGA